MVCIYLTIVNFTTLEREAQSREEHVERYALVAREMMHPFLAGLSGNGLLVVCDNYLALSVLMPC